MKSKRTIDKWDELERLARKNARCVWTSDDGWIVTQDIFDGCDAHYSETVDDAIEWERGYK